MNKTAPESSSEAILEDAGCSEKVIAHCRAVRDCACEYAARNSAIDFSLVEQGAMLHDIGRGRTHDIRHAQCGADLVRSMNLGEDLARIVECHTGAGLTADECTLLGLSPRECMPRTTEEKIVTHADNLIAGKKRVTIHESIASAYHLPRKARMRMWRLACEVEMLCDG
ncbi:MULTISPECIES: HDIG domain-containing metalloprotein [unclassified Methanoregula]|uniref:HDIG domain-containing metalloprotein n=1 Tax=unclassified Methanoregula TaxID=2649730 RepID=UPI0025EFB334|nr:MULTISPECIES: HDIG domain-containing metalloprotein [unclassified Methanoregula]